MEKNVAEYIYLNLDRVVDITPDMNIKLNRLFSVWNAQNIDVDIFRRHFGMSENAGVFTILAFMTEHMADKSYTDFGKESNLADYVYYRFGQIADLTPEREKELNELFVAWNAKKRDVSEFKFDFALGENAGLNKILPFMVKHASDSIYTSFGLEESIVKGK